MKRNSLEFTLAALAVALLAGCQEVGASRGIAETVSANQSSLSLGNGDSIEGFYQWCQGHEDGAPWTTTIGSPATSTLKVAFRDTDCRIWLSTLKKGTDVYNLILPGTVSEPSPILILPTFLKQQMALARHATNQNDATAVNAYGTGLSYADSTFSIQVLVGKPGELLSIEYPVSAADLAQP